MVRKRSGTGTDIIFEIV